MISDETLAELFRFEYERSRSLISAIAAVRCAVEARAEEAAHQRLLKERRDHVRELARVYQVSVMPSGPRGEEPRDIEPSFARRVLELVAADAGVLVAEVLKGGLCRSLVRARFVAAAVLKRCGFSYPAIARALGMSDHTRALAGVRRVEATPELAARRDRVLAAVSNARQEAA